MTDAKYQGTLKPIKYTSTAINEIKVMLERVKVKTKEILLVKGMISDSSLIHGSPSAIF